MFLALYQLSYKLPEGSKARLELATSLLAGDNPRSSAQRIQTSDKGWRGVDRTPGPVVGFETH